MTRYSEVYETRINEVTGEPEAILVSQVEIPGSPDLTSGMVDLIGGRATVETSFAGRSVILTRIQDNTTAVGSVYVHTPSTIVGVSFQIRSSNANDVGTIYWEIVE